MDRNIKILEAAREEAEARGRICGTQAMLDYLNSLIDTRIGIVAGDGCYYPRANFESNSNLRKRLKGAE